MRQALRPVENASMRNLSQLALLTGISPTFALLGGLVDERIHLGFTNWRSACRAAGLSLSSLTYFTLELLPTAVIGALLGGLLILAPAFAASQQAPSVGSCLAAHAGCAIAMPAGLILCALALPIPLMFGAEVALAVAMASILHGLTTRTSAIRVPRHP